jgi:NADH:ubiquinone oxidoreductase subunit C
MLMQDRVKEALGAKILDWYEHNPRRIYIAIKPEDIKEAAFALFKNLGLRFNTASGQDTPLGLEILYHFSADQSGEIFSLRVKIPDKKSPEIDSLAVIFPAAEWIEREIWEMLGINFKGHPNLKRLLLSEEWPEGEHPLRHQ